jgi:hypothetical protein
MTGAAGADWTCLPTWFNSLMAIPARKTHPAFDKPLSHFAFVRSSTPSVTFVDARRAVH